MGRPSSYKIASVRVANVLMLADGDRETDAVTGLSHTLSALSDLLLQTHSNGGVFDLSENPSYQP